jgi:hypothetical protein
MSDYIPLWKRGMTLTLHTESGLLRAVVTGEFSPEEGERTFLELLDAVVRRKVEKVLFDGRELIGQPDVIHRFLYGEYVAFTVARYVAARGLSHTPQFAYVLLEPVLDPLRFGESVAVHRGMWVKAFDNLEDARRWLESAGDGDAETGHA